MLHSKPSRENSLDEAVKAPIDYTISQDFAAGHAAEQARRLRGFHDEANSNLVQRSQTTKRLLRARRKRQQEENEENEKLAQSRPELLELSRKRQKLDATANDMDENLTSTLATMGQVTSGIDQASNYDVRSLHKISLQETDVCRRSLAISESSIRSLAQAKTNIDTTRQIFSRMSHSQTLQLIVADTMAKSISRIALPSTILENTWRKTRILRSSYYDLTNAPAEPQFKAKKYPSSQVPCDQLYTLLLDVISARTSTVLRQNALFLFR